MAEMFVENWMKDFVAFAMKFGSCKNMAMF